MIGLLCWCATCAAMQVGAAAAPIRAFAAAAAVRTAPVRAQSLKEGMDGLPEVDPEGELIYDPETDPLGRSEFVKWYRYEKAIEKYEKENPRDVFKAAGERLKGPAQSVAVLLLGFYSLPVVKAISDGVREGNIFTSLSRAFEEPTKVLDLGAPIDLGSLGQ